VTTATVPADTVGTVAVSMPYYRTQGTVRRAVDAVLAQTMPHLRLYLVNDGDRDTPPWPMLADITDPRLIRIDLPTNRGRYFCDAAVIAQACEPWIAIHDADDWSEPDWLAQLLAAALTTGAIAAVAPQWVHGRTSTLEPVHPTMRPGAGPMRHLAHHAAVYRTDVAQHLGGHPGYRIGFDTLWTNLVAMCGPIAVVDRPLYHRGIRPGSLTTHPTTRRGSAARQSARRRLNDLYRRAVVAQDPAQVLRDDVPPALADEVTAIANGIRDGTLAVDAGKDTPVSLHPPRVNTPIIDDPSAWTGWSLDRHTAHELSATLHHRQPRIVVEAGSGSSTVLLGEYAARTGATVVSLEHSRVHHALTAQRLRERGLTDHVRLVLADLGNRDTLFGSMPWYRADLPTAIDFALIDGPPGTVGRSAAMPALWPSLAGEWRVWLDDAHRDGELSAVAVWAGAYPITVETVALPKGLAVIRPAPSGPDPVDAADVAVTIVTGGRPGLLAATLDSLTANAPGLLESAYVAVLVNGPDRATMAVLDEREHLLDHRVVISERLPIGQTAHAMLGSPAPRPYTLHLEDDWVAATTVPGWLGRARQVLTDRPDVGQVRLRHRGDTVLARHMITRKPIDWQPAAHSHLVAHAHYTLNPSLMRSADTPTVWTQPDGENQAARRFAATGALTAQASPGVFLHTGDGKSLRLGQVGGRVR
jgi:predicted O-methyltransferase YrrM